MSQQSKADNPDDGNKLTEPVSMLTVMQFVKHLSFDNLNGSMGCLHHTLALRRKEPRSSGCRRSFAA